MTCEYIVRVVVSKVSDLKSYITFMASESPDGDLVNHSKLNIFKIKMKKWSNHSKLNIF